MHENDYNLSASMLKFSQNMPPPSDYSTQKENLEYENRGLTPA